MAYHLHYVTDSRATPSQQDKVMMKTFYEAFVAKFSDKFLSDKFCPFGPNYVWYSSDLFPSGAVCSLESALEFELTAGVDVQGNPWGQAWSRSFFVPIDLIDEVWEWSKANRLQLDVLKHPHTGCMHDDHGLRGVWEGTAHHLDLLEFPCNVPGTGCQDLDYSGPPSCGCEGARASDAPEDACENCVM